MNKGEKMKCPTKADLYERELACKNKLKQAKHEIKCLRKYIAEIEADNQKLDLYILESIK